MAENKMHKDNTSMIIIIIIIVAIILALVAYLSMNGKEEAKDIIDDTKDTIENMTDSSQKTSEMIMGSYQGTYTLNSTNTTTSEEADETNSSEYYFELVLNEDGSGQLVRTSDSENIISGSYMVSDNKVVFTKNNSLIDNTAEENMETDANNEITSTYEFTVNDDDTLTYDSGSKSIILSKTKKENLKYIK